MLWLYKPKISTVPLSFYSSIYHPARMGITKKTINIRDDQEEWLKKQSYINLSKFVQRKLDEEIKKQNSSVDNSATDKNILGG